MIIELPDDLFTEEELENTPGRYARFLEEWKRDREEFKFTTFPSEGLDSMIAQTNIPFHSMCAHHLLPFSGTAHVGYIPKPDGVYCGLSKLARAVDMWAHRPQNQERMTKQIAEYLMQKLDPQGVIVVTDATHQCMEIRGVQKHQAVTVTSEAIGIFREAEMESKFFQLIEMGRHR